MGIFDIFSSDDSDSAVGKRVLQAYFDSAVSFPEFQFGDFDSWLTWLNSRVPSFDEVIGNLVKINYASTTEGQAQDRVALLANQTGGQANVSDITLAAGGKGDSVNWGAAIPEVGAQTVSDTIKYGTEVLQNTGTGVMSTLALVKYLPWILGGAAAIYIFSFGRTSGKKLGKSAEGLSKSLGESAKKLADAASDRIKRK